MSAAQGHGQGTVSRPVALLALVLVAGIAAMQLNGRSDAAEAEGCPDYIPVDQPLIAHAGGGLPDRFYANNRAALDLAASHGFRLIELDFITVDGELGLGHDEGRISDMSMNELEEWLDAHPDISIVTDIKSGNGYLPQLRDRLGAARLIPQIYDPSEYPAVRELGFERVIFTAYRMPRDDWQEEVNAMDLFAVTVPETRRHLADGVHHQVFLHTVNRPIEGYGLYTDCLIPA